MLRKIYRWLKARPVSDDQCPHCKQYGTLRRYGIDVVCFECGLMQ